MQLFYSFGSCDSECAVVITASILYFFSMGNAISPKIRINKKSMARFLEYCYSLIYFFRFIFTWACGTGSVRWYSNWPKSGYQTVAVSIEFHWISVHLFYSSYKEKILNWNSWLGLRIGDKPHLWLHLNFSYVYYIVQWHDNNTDIPICHIVTLQLSIKNHRHRNQNVISHFLTFSI